MTRALITGITGQDGLYLAESLLDQTLRRGVDRRRRIVEDEDPRVDE